jgi:Ala-tRNA(Pro) deacylase
VRIAYNFVGETFVPQGGLAMLSRILDYLDQNGVQYDHHAHPEAHTAREVAAAEHVPTHEVAKTVVFLDENGYGMAVLRADCAVDMHELRMLLGPRLRLATERELVDLFPECELGAMPPFGSLFRMPVYADSRLAQEELIEFNAGTHRDVIRLRYRDYESLAKPIVVDFARVVAS